MYLIPIAIILTVAALLLASPIKRHNKTIVTTNYTVTSERLPKSFDGFTIVQVSDLHNALFGSGNCDLIKAVKDAVPDIIAITGDTMNAYAPSAAEACALMDELVKIAPVYFVTGNHEYRTEAEFSKLYEHMKSIGVTVLRDESCTIERDNEHITVVGVEDPTYSGIFDFVYSDEFAKKVCSLTPKEGFVLTLSHRPDILDKYSASGADLVLSGHAHGGQFRLPVLGAAFAPNQGFFPKFTEGVHFKNGTALVISRGLGNSSFPFRLNNPPEIVAVTLEAK